MRLLTSTPYPEAPTHFSNVYLEKKKKLVLRHGGLNLTKHGQNACLFTLEIESKLPLVCSLAPSRKTELVFAKVAAFMDYNHFKLYFLGRQERFVMI